MPEAPEVQTVIDWLRDELTGKTIVKAAISHEKLADNLSSEEFCKDLCHQTFEQFQRHGKYLIFVLSDYDWICHLRMEGKFWILDRISEEEKIRKHIHALFWLNDGRILMYYDTRKFGRMQLYPRTEDVDHLPALAKLGPDVLDEKFNANWLYQKIHRRKIAIKTALLDQKVVAGIGNIYADEICFEAGLDPRSLCSALDKEDCKKLCEAAREILKMAIEKKGTTIRSFSSGNHEPGIFQDFLKVHQKENEECSRCQHTIEKTQVGGRTTYYCPCCQKKKGLD